jgi:cytochrome c peroxidase
VRRVLAGLAALAALACAPSDTTDPPEPWAWRLPSHFDAPLVPVDNPMTAAKVDLGRHLFYEERLSVSGDVSCGTCHVQALAFTDGEATSVGADGLHGTRSSMSLGNVAYMPTLTWGNPVLDSLESQALVPLFLDVPMEMGAQYVIDDVLEAFASEDAWIDRFVAAFPEDDPFTIANVAKALAAFQRTLVSADSPYDRWLLGDSGALSPSAQRGLSLFGSERLGCATCHASVLQTASFRSDTAPRGTSRFENTGLYDLGEAGGEYPLPNTGLHEFTHDPADLGRHRVPSLRNVAVTAPYMHDGTIADLEGVIDHYAAGGRTITEGPRAGIGADNPHKSSLVRGFTITDPERADLVAFLHALTDEAFLADPRFADPREAAP